SYDKNEINYLDQYGEEVFNLYNNEIWFFDLMDKIQQSIGAQIDCKKIEYNSSLELFDDDYINDVFHIDNHYLQINNSFYQIFKSETNTTIKINNEVNKQFFLFKNYSKEMNFNEIKDLLNSLISSNNSPRLFEIIRKIDDEKLIEYTYKLIIDNEKFDEFINENININFDILYSILKSLDLSTVLKTVKYNENIVKTLVEIDIENKKQWLKSFPIDINVNNEERFIVYLINEYQLKLSKDMNFFSNSKIQKQIIEYISLVSIFKEKSKYNTESNYDEIKELYNTCTNEVRNLPNKINEIELLKSEIKDTWEKFRDEYKHDLVEQSVLIVKDIRAYVEPLQKKYPDNYFWKTKIYEIDNELDEKIDYQKKFTSTHKYMHADTSGLKNEVSIDSINNLKNIREFFKNISEKEKRIK
ncbi:MAG: hypothetical protein RRZ34_02110, partial [Malacoplasma sp.]